MEDSIQGWTQLGPLSHKSRHFFRFSKKGRGGFPTFPLVVRLKQLLKLYQNPWKKNSEGAPIHLLKLKILISQLHKWTPL